MIFIPTSGEARAGKFMFVREDESWQDGIRLE